MINEEKKKNFTKINNIKTKFSPKVNSNNVPIKSVFTKSKNTNPFKEKNTKLNLRKKNLILKNLSSDIAEKAVNSVCSNSKESIINGNLSHILTLNKAESTKNTNGDNKMQNSVFQTYNTSSFQFNNCRSNHNSKLTKRTYDFPNSQKNIIKASNSLNINSCEIDSGQNPKLSNIDHNNSKNKEPISKNSFEFVKKKSNVISIKNEKLKAYFKKLLEKARPSQNMNFSKNINNKFNSIQNKVNNQLHLQENIKKKYTSNNADESTNPLKKHDSTLKLKLQNYVRKRVSSSIINNNSKVKEEDNNLRDINIEEDIIIRKGFSSIENNLEKVNLKQNLLKIKDRSDEMKMNKNLSSFDIKNLLDMNLKNKNIKPNRINNRSNDYLVINDYNSLPANLKETVMDDYNMNEFNEDNDDEIRELNKIVKKLDFENISHNDNLIFDKNKYKKVSNNVNVDNFFDFLFSNKKE